MGQVLDVLQISVQLGPRRTTMTAGPNVAVGEPPQEAMTIIGFPAGAKASRLQDLRGYR